MTKDKILTAMAGLSKADLLAIRAMADSLLGTPGTKALQGPLAWLYEALMAELGANLPYAQFANTNAGRAFDKRGPAFVAFIQAEFKQSMQRKVAALAIMRLVLGLLIADLKERKTPITFFTLASSLDRAPGVFDPSLPRLLGKRVGWYHSYVNRGHSGLVVSS